MSSGTQVDLDWAGLCAGGEGTGANGAPVGNGAGAGATVGGAGTASAAGAFLSDEEILGIDPVGAVAPPRGTVILSEAKNPSSIDGNGNDPQTPRDSSGKNGPRFTEIAQREQNDNQNNFAERIANPQMPEWMRTATAADPAHGAEAQALWREHQEFRAAFSSAREARAVADEARAIKELLPGGVKDVVSLREATASVDRIDAALFSGDARAQSEVVAELARANPAAFRSMFAEAARVLAGMGTGAEGVRFDGAGAERLADGNEVRRDGERVAPVESDATAVGRENRRPLLHRGEQDAGATNAFDPAAYANFERATNDNVARDVRGAIGETLGRVMPEGVAEGAARRIGEDIFNEVHRALAADRALSEQVAAVLRDRRFDGAEQQRVTALLAGRAKQLVPSVARRVIGEWTSTVLHTARSKAARQAVAASRVDIAAPGGSLDSMPLRAMSSKEVNYASMSDEEILGI